MRLVSNNIYKFAKAFVLCIVIVLALSSWGTYGHERINHAAVLALPEPLQIFFYNHIDFITHESTVPDLRKYTLADKSEKPRHFVCLEAFGSVSDSPIKWQDVKTKYDEVFLKKNGILPWYLDSMMKKLTKAFREKRKTEILFLAGDLGHYLGDAHMPLHTTVNGDGRTSDQKGIHAFWEAHLPELYGNTYNYKVPEATYITNIEDEIWRIIYSSYSLVDSMLLKDEQLRKTFKGKIYKEDSSGKILKNKFNQPFHTTEYASKYNDLLSGMVERQLRGAISATANFWFTAWVNAGKPDLANMDSKELTDRNRSNLRSELKHYEEGKLVGLESEKEF